MTLRGEGEGQAGLRHWNDSTGERGRTRQGYVTGITPLGRWEFRQGYVTGMTPLGRGGRTRQGYVTGMTPLGRGEG